jgi:small-conductance mechanosensitive channel
MIILSSMGINIGPMIAGAGVIGLAIGFGSQTLVRDILSGVFFLIDDAFRVGDYIESGGIKGMVQHISLRSVKLRHPRGMVFTIPFGDMGALQNFSRDYIITKLDVRVYKRIQERFREEGIEFAHRNVTVYFPPESAQTASGEEPDKGAETAGAPDKKLIEAGAAAAISAAQVDEDAKRPKG